MQNRDLNTQIASAITIAPLIRTTTVTGTGVDLSGYHSTAIVVQAGAITDGTHTLSIEESDDNATFTAVAAGELSGTPGALSANTVTEIGYLGFKRYVRAKVTVTGSPSTGGNYSGLVIRGGGSVNPI